MPNIKWQGYIMSGPQRRTQRRHAGATTATTNGSREGATTGKRTCLQHTVWMRYQQIMWKWVFNSKHMATINLASYYYFSIIGNHVRNIFSTDIFNCKKVSRQFLNWRKTDGQIFKFWPVITILALWAIFVRTDFSTDIFNCKKGSGQFFSTEERLLAIFQILASYD